MILELEYNKHAYSFSSDSGSDSAPDSHEDSDLGLCYLCSTIKELVLKVVVVVVGPAKAVDTVVDIEMVVETRLLPHKNMYNMVEEPWELDNAEQWRSIVTTSPRRTMG